MPNRNNEQNISRDDEFQELKQEMTSYKKSYELLLTSMAEKDESIKSLAIDREKYLNNLENKNLAIKERNEIESKLVITQNNLENTIHDVNARDEKINSLKAEKEESEITLHRLQEKYHEIGSGSKPKHY